MNRFITYLKTHVGRRGTVLAVYSLVYLFVGVKALADPAMDNGRFVVYTLVPVWARALIWLVPFLLGIISAVRPYPKRDWLGFAALTIPPAILIVSYLGSTLAFFLGYTTYHLAWLDAFEWSLILIVLLVTSGWTEDTPLPQKDESR